MPTGDAVAVNPVTGDLTYPTTGAAAGQVQGVAAHDAPAVGNPIRVGVRHRAAPATVADGDLTDLLVDEYGQLKVVVLGTASVTQKPSAATDGLSIFHLVSAASTNATNVKASAGQLYGYEITNTNAAARKVAFHNTAGSPTAGAGVVFSVLVPAAGHVSLAIDSGIAFATGIAITTVTENADSGTTAVGSGDLNINLFYK